MDHNNGSDIEEGRITTSDEKSTDGSSSSLSSSAAVTRGLPGHTEAKLNVSNSPDGKNLASDGKDAADRFEHRVRRKIMAEGGKTTTSTSELHHSGQDKHGSESGQGQDSLDAKRVACGGGDATAADRFEDRLKRKLSDGNETTSSATDRFEDRLKRKLSDGNETTSSATDRFEDRLKRKLSDGNETTSSATDRFEDRLKRKLSDGNETTSSATDRFEDRLKRKLSDGNETTSSATDRFEDRLKRKLSDGNETTSSATDRFEDRLKRKLSDGNTTTADNSKSPDENDGLSEQGQDSPDVEHVASGGGADAIDRFEDRLKRKMAEGSKTTAATEELHHSDQDESDACNEQGRFIASENTNALRPFNSAEFEDESKPQIDFGEDSTDEDDGPPLPLVYQQDSLTETKMEAASQISGTNSSGSNSQVNEASTAVAVGGNESRGGGHSVQQMDEHEPENLQQPSAGPGINSTSDDDDAYQVLSTAERDVQFSILNAYLVEDEEEEGVHDTVYEATLVEPELPWWKQRRIKFLLTIFCVLITAFAVSLGVTLPRSEITVTAPPSAAVKNTDPPSMSLHPSQSPSERSYACFADRDILKYATTQYYNTTGCNKEVDFCPAKIVDKYGWPIGSWCVDDVTDMASLFEGLDIFDEDLSGWKVGQVTNMNRMFFGASSFNQDLSSWNISAATNAREMFTGAISFNQNLCMWEDTFPYSNANDMFVDSGCTIKHDPSSVHRGPFCAFYCNEVSPTDCFTNRDELKAAVDQYVQGLWGEDDSSKYGWPIGSWCVGNVTDMSELFRDLRTFDEDISMWDVGQVTDMSRMFLAASSFNRDLSSWNTSAVNTMKKMFDKAASFDGDISSWDTSRVTDMSFMFFDASSFNQKNLSRWDTSAIIAMDAMFHNASSFNGDISSWNTAAVTDMSRMFWGASSLNQSDLSLWDTSAVNTMESMFEGALSFNGDVSSWDTSAVTDMSYMFNKAASFDGDISSWDTSAVTDMSYMFFRASSFKEEDLSRWDTVSVATMKAMFYKSSSFNGDISSWNTAAVTDMSYMFWGASSFNQKGLSNWDISFATTMFSMFYEATSFNQNLCAWKDNFPYSGATDIFVDSGCTFADIPRSEQGGPFCASSCTDS